MCVKCTRVQSSVPVKMHYGTPEYTAQFDYEVFEETQHYVDKDDVHNCMRYRVSPGDDFVDVYEDGCVWYLRVHDINIFDTSQYIDHRLLGANGVEHHAMLQLFKINK
jgi:hypothetical protein